ncbi:hypothetical protein MKEN_01102200 [Mycena kentingensis (nom. inval.)]|nr:hypothetical protein MKEN_01102200 [Mycena kentingensis (nom. inval.)]
MSILGILERFHATRNFLGLDTCVVASARYRNVEGRGLTREVLFPALRQVVLAHPSLCVGLKDERAKNACFVRRDSVDLERVVRFSEARELRIVLEDELARGFDASDVLWRVTVLPDNTVVFADHHVIGDGLSTVAFHLELLEALQNSGTDDASSIIKVPRTLELAPPIERLTSVRPSLWAVASQLFQGFAPKIGARRVAASWTGNPTPQTPDNLLQPRVCLATISPNEVDALRKICRIHGATLTSAFYVLTVATLARLLEGTAYKYVPVGVAVSLRDLTQPPIAKTEICDAVSQQTTVSALDAEFSWKTAGSFAAKLKTQRPSSRETIGMLGLLGKDYTAFVRKHMAKEGSSWSMEKVVFAQSDVVLGAAFKMNVVGDTDGGVNFAFTWGRPSVEEGFVDEQFVPAFMEALRALLE